MNEMHVGMIGVGNMGGAMARRMLEMGAKLTVFDHNCETLSAFRSAGAAIAASPREVADQCSIVFSCLPSPEASIDVATGSQGVALGRSIEVYVETSTIGRKTIELIAERLRAQNIGFLDCPISGGPRRALLGTLALMVSGAEADFVQAKPALDLIGECFHLGAKPGISQVAKLINNHISAAGRVAVFEGLAMGAKAGMDLKALNDVLNAGTARNDTTVHKVPLAILSGTYKYGGPLTTGLKDEALMIEEAKVFDSPLWLGPRILELYREAAAAGYRHEDSMRLFTYVQSVDASRKEEPVEPKA
jgi:3-hydroxyisobutyrate dehydrogenase-like beta-hydroxyacid dehydrogenase